MEMCELIANDILNIVNLMQTFEYLLKLLDSILRYCRGVSRIFERGGGPISLGSLKKGHQILKSGVQWSDGGVQYISVTRTTNLAYLDAKE